MKYKLKGNYDENIVKQICETRSVNYSDLDMFINPNIWYVTNPFNYKNMVEIATAILEAVKDNLKIGILIDSDVDGYCSSAMLVNYLYDVLDYKNIRFYLHEEKQHGLTPYIMDKIKACLPNVLIIPDASSSDFKQHKELRELGVKTLIIDHHETDGYSMDATVVNNQIDENGNKTLSAGGLVLKLLEAMDFLLCKSESVNYYDLASVSLVGDCMLMNNLETRYYVQKGLVNVNNSLIQELMKAEGSRSYETVSFEIAPVINAFIRVGTKEEKQDLFLALINDKSERQITLRGQGTFNLALPEYIAKMASRIKSRQTKEINKALDSLVLLEHENLPFTFCVLDDSALRSLTGLIGNRLVEKYNKPAIVVKDFGDKYRGSGRTTDTFEDFKGYCNRSGYFDLAQGHKGAFGVVISKEKSSKMMIELKDKKLDDDSDCYIVDRAYFDFVSAFDIMSISELNRYWSRGFEKPLFYINLKLEGNEVDIIGAKRNTIRIRKDNITYVKFKCSEEEIKQIENKVVKQVEIIGTFNVNEYYDNLYPQVLIEELEYIGEEKKTQQAFGFSFENFTNMKW